MKVLKYYFFTLIGIPKNFFLTFRVALVKIFKGSTSQNGCYLAGMELGLNLVKLA